MAIIPALAAILGASVTAVFSYFNEKRKADSQRSNEEMRLKANIVTTERLRWLQDIRQRLSHLYGQIDMQYSLLKRPVNENKHSKVQKELDELSKEIMEQINIITTMLNPEKPDQRQLRQSLQQKLEFLTECFQQKKLSQELSGPTQFNDSKYSNIKQSVFDALTNIGIETWKQIKNLE